MRVQKARVGVIGVALLAALLGGVGQAEAVILFDNLDVGDGFSAGTGALVEKDGPPNLLIPPAQRPTFFERAIGFIPVGQDSTFDRVDLALDQALFRNSGPPELDIFLAKDAWGVPGAILETIRLTGIPPAAFPALPPLSTANSLLHPALRAGELYWIGAAATDSGTSILWHLNSLGDIGPRATRTDGFFQGGVWTRDGGLDAELTRYAMRVHGTVIPEPSSLLLLGTGLLGLAGLGRQRRL